MSSADSDLWLAGHIQPKVIILRQPERTPADDPLIFIAIGRRRTGLLLQVRINVPGMRFPDGRVNYIDWRNMRAIPVAAVGKKSSGIWGQQRERRAVAIRRRPPAASEERPFT